MNKFSLFPNNLFYKSRGNKEKNDPAHELGIKF